MKKYHWFLLTVPFVFLIAVQPQKVPQDTIRTAEQSIADSNTQITAKPQADTQNTVVQNTIKTNNEDVNWTAILSLLLAFSMAVYGIWQGRRVKKLENHLDQLAATKKFEEQAEAKKTAAVEQTTLDRYYEALSVKAKLFQTQIIGFESRNPKLDLEKTFVHLKLSRTNGSKTQDRSGEMEKRDPGEKKLEPNALLQMVISKKNNKVLLILGDAGAGKTTLLSYYALCCREQNHHRLGFKKPVIALFLPLRDFNPEQTLAKNLSDWLEKTKKINVDDFDKWLNNENILLLLDGLDEIHEFDKRQAVCEYIGENIADLSNVQVVLTSRKEAIAAPKGKQDILDFDYVLAEVDDFDPKQKQEFLLKWFTGALIADSEKDERSEDCTDEKSQAQEEADGLMKFLDLEENRSLNDLSGIPMLLQIMAIVWLNHGGLQNNRAQLYTKALNYLLEDRDRKKKRPLPLTADEAMRVLQPAALSLQEDGEDTVLKTDMHATMQAKLHEVKEELQPEVFCKFLIERANILVDYGDNKYNFRHKSFREYFAGMQLAEVYKEENKLSWIVDNGDWNWWRETLRFFVSKASSKGFDDLMTAFFASNRSEDLDSDAQRDLALLVRERAETEITALLAVLNNKAKTIKQKRYALNCLKNIAEGKVAIALQDVVDENKLPEELHNRAQEIIFEIKGERFEITPADKKSPALFTTLPKSFLNPYEYNLEYILIKKGSYSYQARQTEKSAESVVNLYFAKYPVTNKRYRRFLRYLRGAETDLNKHLNHNLFADLFLGWLQADKIFNDYYGSDAAAWQEKLKAKYDGDRKFNQDEQPVVGVCWYDARAYCFWLSALAAAERTDIARLDIQQFADIYRLPNDIEWQWAASGGKRKYPWGAQEPDESRANYYPHGKSTSPVGGYPQGATPEDLHDMAGNAWEWMDNLYDKKADSGARSVRGGSWNFSTDNLLCNDRLRYIPVNWNNLIGFRVVRAQSSFETL